MLKKVSFAACLAISLGAAQTTVSLYEATASGAGKKVGEVVIAETEFGLLFTPSLKGIPNGVHGFHVHANASCEPTKDKEGKVTPAGGAGGHFDPTKTDAHKGPYDKTGHLGDLPALYADASGNVFYPVLAPRIKKISEISNHALMLHAGGDNHSDQPAPLGGGGARFACGVIK
jgi:Cu-Zn family superoxide dismutase